MRICLLTKSQKIMLKTATKTLQLILRESRMLIQRWCRKKRKTSLKSLGRLMTSMLVRVRRRIRTMVVSHNHWTLLGQGRQKSQLSATIFSANLATKRNSSQRRMPSRQRIRLPTNLSSMMCQLTLKPNPRRRCYTLKSAV